MIPLHILHSSTFSGFTMTIHIAWKALAGFVVTRNLLLPTRVEEINKHVISTQRTNLLLFDMNTWWVDDSDSCFRWQFYGVWPSQYIKTQKSRGDPSLRRAFKWGSWVYDYTY
jgi:hypothetical protein